MFGGGGGTACPSVAHDSSRMRFGAEAAAQVRVRNKP